MAESELDRGVRVAVEGCVSPSQHLTISVSLTHPDEFIQGHGTLHAIYASIDEACRVKGWDGVDLLIIGGDFQVRLPKIPPVRSC